MSISIKKEIDRRVQEALELVHEPELESWKKELSKMENGSEVALFTKSLPHINKKYKVHHVRATFNCPIDQLNQAFDPDYMKKWVRLLSNHQTLETIDSSSEIRHQEYKSNFWMLSNRCFCTLVSHWNNTLPDGSREYLFLNSSISHPDAEKYKGQSVLGDLYNFLYCKEQSEKTEIVYFISLDPKGKIPSKLVDWNNKETLNRVVNLKICCEGNWAQN